MATIVYVGLVISKGIFLEDDIYTFDLKPIA